MRHGDAAGGRPEILPCQMQEDRAAAARYTRNRVVIDLDDKIIEMILTHQPVAALTVREPDWLIVVAVPRVFAPRIRGPGGANMQECARPKVPVFRPPQSPRGEKHFLRSALPLAAIGNQAAP